MKKIISLLLVLTFALGAAVALTSCGAPEDDGAQIKVYLGEKVYDFDPTDYYVDSNAELVMSLLYDPLFRLDENGKLTCDGAADYYEVDENKNSIVINLKETYWSDGARVKADDYIYAWRNILLDPNDANPAAALFYDIKDAVRVKNGETSAYDFGAVASGTYQITITYRNGANYDQLLKNLATVASSPIRQDIATDITKGYWSKLVNTVVTNGPFMVNRINKDKSFTLERNKGYHQELGLKDPTKKVRPAKLIGLGDVTYEDIEKNVVFYMTDAPLSDRSKHKDDAFVADHLSTYTYVFNTDRELFNEEHANIRKALSVAINRNAIIEAITFGKAATGFLPDTVVNTATGKSFNKDTADLISASGNIEEARRLLAEVEDFEQLDKSFTLTVNDDEESLAIANIVKSTWEQLGFTVTVDAAKPIVTEVGEGASMNVITDSKLQVIVNNATRKDFYGDDRAYDVIGIDWLMYSEDPFVALSAFAKKYSGSGVSLPNNDVVYDNICGYTSEAYDTLIKRAYNETDVNERNELLHQAEKHLVDSACVVPLVFNQTFTFESDDISKVVFDGYGNVVLTDMKQKNYEDYLD